MSELQDSIDATAVAWLVRVNEPSFTDWEAWEAWLAQDPAHAEAYWRFAVDEADIRQGLALRHAAERQAVSGPLPVRDPAVRVWPDRRWVAAFAAMAAAVVVAVLVGGPMLRVQTIETDVGEQRSVTLADGSRVHLDANTRLTRTRGEARSLTLVKGRALFEVTHDEANPFTVAVADAKVVDLGTVFEITRLEQGVRVGVSEGIVRYDADGQETTLQAGEGLTDLNGVVRRRRVMTDAVSGWRSGRLAYQAETLRVVAEDLSRELNRQVVADPQVAGRSFTGSLTTDGPQTDIRARLELLMDVVVATDGESWRLQARHRP